MKNETENNGLGLPTRERVIETVIDIFVREIGFIERKEVSSTTHIVKDFYIDSDDLSFFAEAVEKHFDIKNRPLRIGRRALHQRSRESPILYYTICQKNEALCHQYLVSNPALVSARNQVLLSSYDCTRSDPETQLSHT